VKSFAIPHFPFEDVLLAEDVQGKRAFGMPAGVESAQYILNKKLMEMKASHDQTLEWMRLGVLKGDITDGSGTSLLNIYTDFGISQTVVGFGTDNATTEEMTKCLSVKRTIEAALLGSRMTGIMGLCGKNFYDAFTTHATVKDAFKYFQQTQNLSGDYRRGFTFAGIEFREYSGVVSLPSGSTSALIGDDDAYFFPVGSDIFVNYFAPADFLETVNTIGLPVYAKQEVMEFNRGLKIHTQSNPLPLCLRPACVVKGTKV
jgi:hypothetical protein